MRKLAKISVFFLTLSAASSLSAVHTVLLKQGKTIKGIVTNQNVDHVEVDTQNGKHMVIPKKSVLKVIYRELAEADEAKIRKEEEEKREKEKERVLAAKREEILKKKQEIAEKEKTTPSYLKAPPVTSIRDSFILSSIDESHPVSLAMANAKCNPFAEYPQYYYLFGAFRFKEPNWSELLPKETVPIRIKQSSSYKDLAITLLGGFLITITRKTVYVEVCEGSGYRLISEDNINRLKEEAVEQIKVEQELKEVEEKYELELLEKDLEKIEKRK